MHSSHAALVQNLSALIFFSRIFKNIYSELFVVGLSFRTVSIASL